MAGCPRPVPLSARAEVVTTRDRSLDCPQDCPQESAAGSCRDRWPGRMGDGGGGRGCVLLGQDRFSPRRAAAAAGAGEDAGVDEPGLSFAGLLRQLRSEAKLTQEELAAAARLS